MKRLFFAIFIFLFNSLPSQAKVSDYAEYAFSDAWLRLLHYQENGHQYQGLIVNDDFYVSAEGKVNPQAELNAEIEAFSQKEDKLKCEFPARFEWLKQQHLVSGNLDNCTEYLQAIDDIRPSGITLLFTDSYMNNPASLFGHTLIRIDTARKGTQMLAHGVNFGADSGEEQGVVFAFKGLFGGYMGSYSIHPYWDIINAYNNIENRDIWEYHLNLTNEEQKMFVNHLYELRNAQIQYFFLNKNCSYMILEILEAVRPELSLTKDFEWWAIPLDTLKKIKNVPNLVDNINYRPARYTKIQTQISLMNEQQFDAFKKGIREHIYNTDNFSEHDKPLILDTLYQYYQYQYVAHELELAEYRKNSFAVLRQRSKTATLSEPKLSGTEPSKAHDSRQVALNVGENRHLSYVEIALRPAYTALTDNNAGLIKGAGLKVLESNWRYYGQRRRLVLQQLTVLDIMALTPTDSIFSPWSYSSGMVLKRTYNPRNFEEGMVADAHFGMGKTLGIFEWFWLYGILSVGGEYGGFIPRNQFVALEPEVGIFSDFEKCRVQISAQRNIATQDFGNRLMYKAEAAFDLTDHMEIVGKYEAERPEHGYNRQEISFGVRYNF